MPEPCPICRGDLWTCCFHPLTPLSQCCDDAEGEACRCNPLEDLPPDFMSRWSEQQSTPAPTLN